jgi:hypothetical protein
VLMITNSSLECDLATTCQTCNALEFPYECCYWDTKMGGRCLFRSKQFHVKHDVLASPEWRTNFARTLREAKAAESAIKLRGPRSLPTRFIPEVKLSRRDKQRSLAIIQRLGIPIIAVSLSEFYDGTRRLGRLKIAKRIGLSKYLGYNGKIWLTTDVPDDLCEHFLRRPKELRNDIIDLNPSFASTPDSSCYQRIPAAISLLNIARTIIATETLSDLDVEFIGLALGSNTSQLLEHAATLQKLGCSLIALPLYEYRRLGLDEIARFRVAQLRSKIRSGVIALSCSPSAGKRLILSDYYSSWSWFSFTDASNFNIDYGTQRLRRFLNRARELSSQRALN